MDMQQPRFEGQAFNYGLADPECFRDAELYVGPCPSACNASQSSGSPQYENHSVYYPDYSVPAAYPSPDGGDSDISQIETAYTTQPQGHNMMQSQVKQEADQFTDIAGVGILPPATAASSMPAPANMAAKQPPKRKRENRYKNAPASVLSRRRAQNRASQRAYRERKDQRIKDLEIMLNQTKMSANAVHDAYQSLQDELIRTRQELRQLMQNPGVAALVAQANFTPPPDYLMPGRNSSATSQASSIPHIHPVTPVPSSSPTMSVPANANAMMNSFDPATGMGLASPDPLEQIYLIPNLGPAMTGAPISGVPMAPEMAFTM